MGRSRRLPGDAADSRRVCRHYFRRHRWRHENLLGLQRRGRSRPAQFGRCRRCLGLPIEPGWLVLGNINVENDKGHADLGIPLSGPRGSGVLSVVATKQAGHWQFERAEVEISGVKERIDLLAKDNKKAG